MMIADKEGETKEIRDMTKKEEGSTHYEFLIHVDSDEEGNEKGSVISVGSF